MFIVYNSQYEHYYNFLLTVQTTIQTVQKRGTVTKKPVTKHMVASDSSYRVVQNKFTHGSSAEGVHSNERNK